MTNVRADFWDDLAREQAEGRAPEDFRPARLDEMSWPTADITVTPARRDELITAAHRVVRSHEVPRSYAPMTPGEWFWVITGAGLMAVWVGVFLLVLYAVTVG